MKKSWNPEWYVFMNGFRLAETKTIGHKWVRFRTSSHDRYSRIKRAVWDACVIRTLNEEQHRINIFNKAHKLGVEMSEYKRANSKSTSRTFADIEADVDYLEMSLRGEVA